LTKELLNICQAAGDAKIYKSSYGVDELWELGAFEFTK
jgi:hypothetical protein